MTNLELTLGTAIRTWRDRLDPRDAGLASPGRRRAAGLRREELALLAGVSVDYIVRLEQGRSVRPSPPVLSALARALQLTKPERDHLFATAGLQPPQDGQVSDFVPGSVQRLITRLGEVPLAVFAADWTLVQWTPLWAALWGDPDRRPREYRNLALSTFLGAPDPGRAVFVRDHDHFERQLVSDLRAAAARYPNDQGLARLIDTIARGSAAFRELWEKGEIRVHEGEQKMIQHPLVGTVHLDCDVMLVPGNDLKVVIYTAAVNTPDAEALDFLRVSAVHSLATDA